MEEESADAAKPDHLKPASKGKKGCFRRVCSFFSMAAHILAISFVSYMIYLAWPFSSLFSWHPVLMSIAFALLMTEAILFFSPDSNLVPKATRKMKVTYHWITNTTAVLCALAGLAIIVVNKERYGKPHFTSWHGLCGICTVVYTCLQATAGSTLLYPKLTAGLAKPADLKLYHATSGLVLFTLACTTLTLGLFTNWFWSTAHGTAWYFCIATVAWLSLVIMNQVTQAYLPKSLKKPSQQY
ncbi:cytochrome b561 domain-containing protein 2-like [Acanthaster planci]|uniref:ascorbate ferrireductase (transmembrane) n=1 Tax=Acanthaster planci TaxID=133434 RepID=A0A8B7Z6C4_ACAPL|nr:cytochrome b561 domain-containing protein 2-like [Acanthaster planci]